MTENTKEKFKSFLELHGAVELTDIKTEETVRITVDGDKKGQQSGSYQLFMNEGNGVPSGYMNNYRSGIYEKWTENVVANQRIPVKVLQKQKTQQAQEKTQQQKMRFKDFEKEWASMEPSNKYHKWLKNKGLKTSFLLRTEIRSDNRGNLVFPIKDKNDQITNLQRIWSTGQKQLEQGGVLAGSFVKIQGDKDTEFVLISEGISTAATVNSITGITHYASLTANNLSNVAKEVQALHPDKIIVFPGDNDFHLTLRDQPLANSGMDKAKEAAEEVGGHAVFPPFKTEELESGLTDWNDFYQDKGFTRTRTALRAAFKKIMDAKKAIESRTHSHNIER